MISCLNIDNRLLNLDSLKFSEDDEILSLLADPKQEEQGFKLLMAKYQEPLYWHIRRMVDVHEDADDLLQNTFIKVFRYIKKFENKSKLYTWLYKIATNETITFLNKQKKNRTTSIESNDRIHHLKANESVDGEKVIEKLKMAIETLPEKQKLIFNMRYYDELTYDQISEILGTSVGGLKASYHHAAKKIETFFRNKDL